LRLGRNLALPISVHFLVLGNIVSVLKILRSELAFIV